MPRAKNPNISLARLTGKPLLRDRAECHVCHVLTGVDADQVFARHIADPSVRAR